MAYLGLAYIMLHMDGTASFCLLCVLSGHLQMLTVAEVQCPVVCAELPALCHAHTYGMLLIQLLAACLILSVCMMLCLANQVHFCAIIVRCP